MAHFQTSNVELAAAANNTTGRTPLLKRWRQKSQKESYKKPEPDPALVDGTLLPSQFRRELTSGMLGIPLEEVDPYYKDTFIVVTSLSQPTIHRYNAGSSFRAFKPLSPLRLAAITILDHWSFALLLGILILVNYGTRRVEDDTTMGGLITYMSDAAFLSVCLLELILKFIAYGVFMGSCTSLRNPWSWLDILIIVTGFCRIWVNLVVLDFIAALRTLKIVPIVPVLHYGFNTLLKTKKKMFDLLLYSLLTILVLSLVGMQAFTGLLSQKCVEKISIDVDDAAELSDPSSTTTTTTTTIATTTASTIPAPAVSAAELHEFNRNPSHWLLATSEGVDFFVCGNKTRLCPKDYVCLQGYGSNPNYGYTFFDNFGWAILSTVRIISQDLVDQIYFLIPSTSITQQLIYFLVVFFFGTFVIVAFAYAVTAHVLEEGCGGDSDSRAGGAVVLAADGTTVSQKRSTSSSRAAPLLQIQPAASTASRSENDEQSLSACFTIFSSLVNKVLANPFMDFFIIGLVLLNMYIDSFEYNLRYKERHPEMGTPLKWMVFVCNLIYILEFLLKLIAEGFKKFFTHAWSVAELILVVVLIAHYIIICVVEDGHSSTTVFGIHLSYLAIHKLLSRWRALRFPFVVMWRTASSNYGGFFLLAAVAGYMLAEVGIVLFKQDYFDKIDHFPHGELPRWNFADLAHARLMIFRVACGEWIQQLWDCLLVGHVTCILFFLSALFICYLLLVQMGVAIIRKTMEKMGEDEKLEQNSEICTIWEEMCSHFRSVGRLACRRNAKVQNDSMVIGVGGGAEAEAEQGRDEEDELSNGVTSPSPRNGPADSSWTRFRQNLLPLFKHKLFTWTSCTIITISFALLADESIHFGRPSGSELSRISSQVFNIIFTIFITFELLLKLIAFGLAKFFTTCECWFDLLMIVERLWVYTMGFSDAHNLNFVSALRPLMLIFRIPNLLVVAGTILNQIRLLWQYLVGAFVVWIIFALLGMRLFAWKFSRCIDSEGDVPDYRSIYNRVDCETHNYTWENSQLTFDHMRRSLVALTSVATINDWTTVAEHGVDSMGVELQPRREGRFYLYTYFLAFLSIGVFWIGNSLLGVLVYYFRKLKMTRELFTECQQMNYDAEKILLLESSSTTDDGEDLAAAKPGRDSSEYKIPEPDWKILELVYDLVTNSMFDLLVQLVIVLDLIGCLMHYALKGHTSDLIWQYICWVITVLYVLELVLKLLAWRSHFFKKYQNVLDLLAVALSVVIALWEGDLSIWGLRLFLRVVFLLKFIPFSLQVKGGRSALLHSIYLTAPALLNLAGLLLIVMLTFGLVGMYEFRHVGGAQAPQPLNFQTFCGSLLVLVQLSFVAGWTKVLQYIGNTYDCDDPDPEFGKPGTCGYPILARCFICAYMAVSYFIVLNMFVVLGVEIVEELRELRAEEVRSSRRSSTAAAAAAATELTGHETQNGQTAAAPAPAAPPENLMAAPLQTPPSPPATPPPTESERKQTYVVVDEQGENAEEIIYADDEGESPTN